MRKLLVISYWLLVLFLPVGFLTLHPDQVLAQGENELLPAGNVIESDYIRAANQIQIDGEIKGDAFLMGGLVTVNGKVDGDLFIAGGKVTVNGEVGNSVRIAGGDVVLNGPVGRSVLLFCRNCSVSRQATIAGSLIVAGGNADVSAPVIGKGFRYFGGRLYLNSPISNEAFVVADREFLLGPAASISGDLKYTGNSEVVVQPGATVAGHIAYEKINKDEQFPRFFGAKTIFSAYDRFRPIVDLVGFAVSALVGYVLLSLFPRFFEKVVTAIERQPYASFGWGVIVLLAIPVVAVLFALTIVGIPITLLLLIVGYVVLVMAKYLMAFFLGRRVLLARWGERRGWAMVAGLVIFYNLGLVPVVGGLVKLLLMLFALGAMVLSYRHKEIFEQDALRVTSGRSPGRSRRK